MLVDKALQQHWSITVTVLPIICHCARRQSQHMGSEMGNTNAGQEQETAIGNNFTQIIPPRSR